MYKNVSEVLVENKVSDMWQAHKGCKCARCRNDTIAYTLNNIPPHYVVSDKGALYAKANLLSAEYDFEVMKQVIIAMNIISANPRHAPSERVE